MLHTLRRILRRALGLPRLMAVPNKRCPHRDPRHARRGDYTVIERDGIAFIVPRRAR